MARNVGRIEVTVDAETGRMKAQIVQAGRAAGHLGGEAAAKAFDDELGDIRGHEMLIRMNTLVRRANAVLEGIVAEPTLHDTKLRGQIRLLEASLRAFEMEVPVEFDPDFAELVAELELMRGLFEDIRVDVEPEVDRLTLARTVLLMEETLGRVRAKIGGDVRDVDLAAAVAKIEAETSGITANIKVKIDETGLAPAFRRTMRQAFGLGPGGGGGAGEEAAEEATEEFRRNFIGGLSQETKAMVSAVVAFADAIAVALEGALAATVAVVSSAFQALGAAVLAAGPALVALGGIVGTLIVGFQGMGDAVSSITDAFSEAVASGQEFNIAGEEIAEAMNALSPAAQDFVRAFAEILPVLSEVRSTVQDRLFAGLDDELRELAGATIPGVTAALSGMADSLNQFIRGFAGIAAGVDFEAIFGNLQPGIDAILDGFLSLTEALEPFIAAATPAFNALAESFRLAAESLDEMIQAGAESGALTGFLLDGVESLRLWYDLTRSVGDALFTLFQAGADSGDAFLVSLTEVITRFDEWMESTRGQAALAEFFELGRETMSALVPILKGLQGLFANLVSPDATSRFAELAAAIGAILPTLGTLLELVGHFEIGTAVIEALNVALGALNTVLGAIPDPVLKAIGSFAGMFIAFESVIGVVGGIVTQLSLMVGALGRATGAILAFAATHPVLTAIGVAVGIIAAQFLDFSGKQAEVAARTKEVTNALADETDRLIASGDAAKTAALGWDTLNTVLLESGEGGEKLALSMGQLGQETEHAAEFVRDFRKAADEGWKETIPVLDELLDKTGLSAEAQERLARAVAHSDENFTSLADLGRITAEEFENLAEAENMTTDELLLIAHALAETKDQAQNLDLKSLARDTLALAVAAGGTAGAMAQQALAIKDTTLATEDLVPTWALYEQLLDQNVTKQAAAAAEAERLAGSFALVDASMIGVVDPLATVNTAMDETATAAGNLGDQLDTIELGAIGEIARISGAAINELAIPLGVAADEAERAATAADSLLTAWELLFGASGDLEEAILDQKDAFAAIEQRLTDAKAKELLLAAAQKERAAGNVEAAEALEEEAEALGDVALTLGRNTQAGRDNRRELIAGADALKARIAQMRENGRSEEEVTRTYRRGKQALFEQALEFSNNREQARRFVREGLDLIPPRKVTELGVIADAAAGVVEDYGEAITLSIPERWTTTFAAQTANAELLIQSLKTDAEALTVRTYDLLFTASTNQAGTDVQTLGTLANGIAQGGYELLFGTNAPAQPTSEIIALEAKARGITVPLYNLLFGSDTDTAAADAEALGTTAQGVENGSPYTASFVALTGDAMSAASAFEDRLNAIDGRTVTVNFRGLEQSGLQSGGQAQYGNLTIAGESGVEFARFPGHARRTLLTTATPVPPGSTVTSAALTHAQMERTAGAAGTVIQKQVIVNQTVTPRIADPMAVATDVINRAAAMAAL